MTEAKHTPGPWELGEFDEYGCYEEMPMTWPDYCRKDTLLSLFPLKMPLERVSAVLLVVSCVAVKMRRGRHVEPA